MITEPTPAEDIEARETARMDAEDDAHTEQWKARRGTILAADHDRIVAEAETRGRAKGLEDAERAVRGLHIAIWSTIETGPEHACEDRSECDYTPDQFRDAYRNALTRLGAQPRPEPIYLHPRRYAQVHAVALREGISDLAALTGLIFGDYALPTLPPSSRQSGSIVAAKAAHDRRLSSADEADLRDDGGDMMPQRFQRRRTPGWRMPDGAIYVGRPTSWGNPWRVTRKGRHWNVKADHEAYTHRFHTERGAVDYSVLMYASWVRLQRDDIRAELTGRDLVCWCPLDQPCHADVLLELANGGAL